MLCPAKKISYLRKRRAEQRAAVGKQACSFARASFRAAGHAHSRCCSCSLGGTAAAAGAACGPQASRLLVATGSLSARRDQQCAAVAPHEQQCWQGLRPNLRQATGSPPVAGTLRSVLRHLCWRYDSPATGTAAAAVLALATYWPLALQIQQEVRSGGLEPNAYILLSRSRDASGVAWAAVARKVDFVFDQRAERGQRSVEGEGATSVLFSLGPWTEECCHTSHPTPHWHTITNHQGSSKNRLPPVVNARRATPGSN